MSKLTWHTETRKLGDLKDYDINPRQISKKAFGELVKSIENFDYVELAAINTDNVIVAGHQRLRALREVLKKQRINADTFEVEVRVPSRELTAQEFKEYNIRSNANTGEWDTDVLLNNFEIPDLQGWGFPQNLLDIWGGEKEPLKDEDIMVEMDDKHPKISVLGDLYEIGCEGRVHRVMCGDSTDSDAVAKLMNGQKADMVFTDPPYGMRLDTDFSDMDKEFKGSKGGNKYDKVIGDNKDFTPELINTIFACFSYCKEIFIWGGDYFAELIPNRIDGSWIVWDKRLEESADKMYGSTFELCWSKNKHKRDIARVKWAGIFGMEKEDTKTRQHPTQKPILLAQWFFNKWGKENDLIADIFLGSGSTLIASDNLKRTCFGMELDPKYIDLILRRWVKYATKENKKYTIKRNGKTIETQPFE